jgi:phage terminase large subunit-like protein
MGEVLYRRPLQAWQVLVADTAGEYDPITGELRYSVVILHVPRRAGKTALVLARLVRRLLGQARSQSWYTAQTGGDAGRTLRREWLPVLRSCGLYGRLKVSLRAGAESLELVRHDASVTCFPPIESALHGTNVDEAVIDEAWAFDLDTGRAVEQAVFPAQLTRPGAQTVIVSAGGTIESTWFDGWLERGEGALAAGEDGIALFEWGADPDAPDYDPTSPATWWTAHPALGDTIRESAIAGELQRAGKDLAGFERSILNVWPRPRALRRQAVDLDRWAALVDLDVVMAGDACAFDVSADRSMAALAHAGVVGERVVGEVLHYRPGTAWVRQAVRDWLAAHPGGVVVADQLAAGVLADQLELGGVDVIRTGPSQMARACADLLDLVTAGLLAHRGQEVLDLAVEFGARRPLGDGWAWSRKASEADACPVVALTLAVWGARTRPRPPPPFVIVARS